jgi:hypothetical protein
MAAAPTHRRPQRRPAGTPPPVHRRLAAWLLTGPIGHFVGGALDFAGALTHYFILRRIRR